MRDRYLGIDIGSVAVSVAVTDEESSIISTSYAFHNGLISKTLLRLFKNIDPTSIKDVGFTSSSRCAVFAKTDLIHAQQEGYSLGEICDGLSYGLAKNIVDAVFHSHSFSNVVAAGGVDLNKSVIGHIENLANIRMTVEVDAYSTAFPEDFGAVFLGIDIGSTSTKAVLLDLNKEIRAGFYTRTAGQPLQAVQVIFEAISDFAFLRNTHFTISGAGTTGSGRKFTGKIVGADIILDEITAHARAAWELDHDTDTIIEIGGQDSKFTTMSNGIVTFSVMNNVCAAGTGSFIEEQAKKLGCSLNEYAGRVEKVSSPRASDRCTVFMERDLNFYMMAGYSTEEILAAVLHSTCENYFSRVASKVHIGDKIFFQGATAKNKALVAALEQKLNKPIMVSRYCHLTGAMGVALELYDQKINNTKFRGLDIYKKTIPVGSEVCELCTNHCKLRIARIDNEIEAYGFLCGRDYGTHKYVKNKSVQFQLMRKRAELFRFKPETRETKIIIGIPSGLHLNEEILLWRKFFDLLSIGTVTSEVYMSPSRDGKNFCGAEFCAPIAAMHGHVDYLSGKCDFIFLPVYLEETLEIRMNKQYCYYTQFVSSVISVRKKFPQRQKILTPILKNSQGELYIRLELYRMLKSIGLNDIGFLTVRNAYEKAKKYVQSVNEEWKSQYENSVKSLDDIHVMLLGRPYTVLSQAMNNSIPEIIEKMGIMTYYMDMLPFRQKRL